MESIQKFFESIGDIFKKEIYQGPVYIYNLTDIKKNLFEKNLDDPLNQISPTDVYNFLKCVPLHTNFKLTYYLVGLVDFKGKVKNVIDEFKPNDRKLKNLLELENLNDYCKIILTEEQNKEYRKFIQQ